VKRLSIQFVLLSILLVACTGTSEPPLDLLLATGSDSAVVFYPAGTEDAAPVGSWEIGEEIVDLLRPSGEPSLWVLTSTKLSIYPLSGGSLSSAPNQTDASAILELAGSCSNGRLISGDACALVDCRNSSVWLIPFAEPALEPVYTGEDEAGTIYLLGPDDQLTRVEPIPNGFKLEYPGIAPYQVLTESNTDHLEAAWAGEELLIAIDTGIETRLYTWTAGANEAPEPAGDPLSGFTALKTIIPLIDGWLIGGDNGYVIRRRDEGDHNRATPTRRAMTTPDFYLYIIGGEDLVVIDLLDPSLSEHHRSLVANPRGLAWLPVEK